MSHNRWVVGIGVSVVVFCSAMGIYLFRSVTYDNPALGVITYKFHWGRPAWQIVDSNRDGNIDSKARLAKNEVYAEEMWEDRNHDGNYEIYMGLNGMDIEVLQIDQDHDGVYDLQLTGTEAANYWAENFQRIRSMSRR
jgi:hypothetical protein